MSAPLRILELKNRLGLLDNPYRFDEETRRRQQGVHGVPGSQGGGQEAGG